MLLTLGAMVAPAVAATPTENDIHITKIVVEPAGSDMNFTIYFESSFFTRVFSIIFGAKVLQPSIEHLFINFSNVSLLSIDANTGVAKVEVRDMSTPSGEGWYVYSGNTAFAATVDVIEVHTSDGKIMTLNDASSLPAISNRVPNTI
jgi:hypothetical protein